MKSKFKINDFYIGNKVLIAGTDVEVSIIGIGSKDFDGIKISPNTPYYTLDKFDGIRLNNENMLGMEFTSEGENVYKHPCGVVVEFLRYGSAILRFNGSILTPVYYTHEVENMLKLFYTQPKNARKRD